MEEEVINEVHSGAAAAAANVDGQRETWAGGALSPHIINFVVIIYFTNYINGLQCSKWNPTANAINHSLVFWVWDPIEIIH